MLIYIAGGIQGNIKYLWRYFLNYYYERNNNNLNIYLAGLQGRRWVVDTYINKVGEKSCGFILPGNAPWKKDGIYEKTIKEEAPYILESFYYADEWTEKAIPLLKGFLLDSGAFTFMSNCKDSKKINFDEYLTRYINFINRNNVKYFFELDVDVVVGYEKVKEYRKRLEKETNKKCIPVWHKSRGLEEYIKLTKEYDYIAIGGIVTKEISPKEYKYFTKLLNIAKENNCKVHGLGFTNLKGLEKYKFYSVDSTSWTTGNRFGSIYKFNGKTMVKYSKKEGQRLANPREVAINNFNEWVKFQKYAEKFL